ncbi:MAG: sulfatase [Flavobacteriaceae bacterium]|nr:MAG: sulfatase [Flavobacteriaceae bacterium]
MKNIILFNIICLLTISACTPPKETLPAPNIVWITSEDNSKHYMKLFDENGIETPNIEKLANHGIKFTRAFSNAPVCSAARSTLIAGCYGPRLASHYHRRLKQVPMPQGVEMYPAYLKQAGYYTTNNSKEDYNIIKSDSVWDDSSKKAHWKNREEGQPFFHVFNISTTHEGNLHFNQAQWDAVKTNADPEAYTTQPNHPQTKLYKYTNAYYRDLIVKMDEEVGAVVAEIEEAGMMENTIIFYFGDHGGVLPGSKGYLYETGLHVPLVIFVPEKYRDLMNREAGSSTEGFVSFVDFGPTLLSLAGIEVPEGMDGKSFLGVGVNPAEVDSRDETFSYANRFDEKSDFVRSIRKGKFKYIRNYQPFNFDGMMNNYRYKMLAYKEWQNLYEKGELNRAQSFFYEPRAPEQLFDVEADPYETKNLAGDPAYTDTLLELRQNLVNRVKSMPDLSFYPEFELINNAFDNPVAFGQKNISAISDYVDIAQLQLLSFADAKSALEEKLSSDDRWARYWALVVLSSFGKEAVVFANNIEKIATDDSELINRVRAAQFLAFCGYQNSNQLILEALYASEDRGQVMLMLNVITQLRDGPQKVDFNIDFSRISDKILGEIQLQWRLEHLGWGKTPTSK